MQPFEKVYFEGQKPDGQSYRQTYQIKRTEDKENPLLTIKELVCRDPILMGFYINGRLNLP